MKLLKRKWSKPLKKVYDLNLQLSIIVAKTAIPME